MLRGSMVFVPKSYREVRRIMWRAGWRPLRQTGSHEVWEERPGGRTVSVPGAGRSGRAMPVGTLASIRRATGLEDLR